MAQNVEAVSRERPWIFQVTTSVVHLADVVALFSSRYARHSEQVVVHSYVLSAVYTVLSRCGDSVARG